MDDVALAADAVQIIAGGQLRWVGTVAELESVAGDVPGSGVSPAEAGYLHLLGDA